MVEYIPNFSELPKHFIILEILWKKGSSSSSWTNRFSAERVETFPIYHDRIYTDLQNASQKIQALKTIWENDGPEASSQNRILFLPRNLVKESKEVLEHVVHTVVSALYPAKGNRIIVTHEGPHIPIIENVLQMINIIQHAKDMAMITANVGTPMYMAQQIKKMFGRKKGCRTKIYNATDISKKKFGLLEAVGKSAKNQPCMIIIERKPRKVSSDSKRVCLVGKGVTFDTGGLSIKSLEGMYDMKYDKIGAVYIAHIMDCVTDDTVFDEHHFIAILPFAENAVSDRSLHPGDVITSYNGTTVEVSDPDAEGRLLLADAFGYANKFKPDILIDLATLTGHADSINCWSNGYVYCEPESLKPKIEKLTYKIGERMLTMPSWIEQRTVLRSDIADIVNSPYHCSDAFVAALFLREFLPTSVKTWIHIDLAHEYDNHIPKGNGIRTIHALIHTLLHS